MACALTLIIDLFVDLLNSTCVNISNTFKVIVLFDNPNPSKSRTKWRATGLPENEALALW